MEAIKYRLEWCRYCLFSKMSKALVRITDNVSETFGTIGRMTEFASRFQWCV